MKKSVNAIEKLRADIDAIDHALVQLLHKRYELVRQIQEIKQQTGIPARDPIRERDMLAERKAWGDTAGLPPELIEHLFRCILQHLPPVHQN